MDEQINGLPDFPDVATAAARATRPPPFEQIVIRARRRHQRSILTTLAVSAAVLAAVGTGAVIVSHGPIAADTPIGPPLTSTPTQPPDPRKVIREGNMDAYAGTANGAVLTLWRSCADPKTGERCTVAWQLNNRLATSVGLADDAGERPSAYAAGDSFVIWAHDRIGFLVDADGGTRQLKPASVEGDPAAGQVVVTRGDHLVVVDPASGTFWPLPAAPGVSRATQAVISSNGTTWAIAAAEHEETWIAWKPDSTSGWQHHKMPADQPGSTLPGYLAVSGDHVAAVSGSDGATILPVVDFAVTTDGGSTWTDLRKTDLPFDAVDAMAATSGGTLYVLSAGGEHLYRSSDSSWTHFTELPNPHKADELVSAGARIVARGGTIHKPTLIEYDDAGNATDLVAPR
jgi:hypothetical protein